MISKLARGLCLPLLVAAACSFTVDMSELEAGCESIGQKMCPPESGQCVPLGNWQTGCAADTCARCTLPNAVATCSSRNECAIADCNSGFDNCDGAARNGCEVNLQTDVRNCGGCGNDCANDRATDNGRGECRSGLCHPGTCLSGFGDCDKIRANGCEANLNTDINNCGGCGDPEDPEDPHVCDSVTERCSLGECVPR
jgi:hypothetical protein